MSATLKQLRDQIIIDNGIEGNPKFPGLRLNRMINLAQKHVQTELNGLGMKKWESSDSLTLSAGTFVAQNVQTAPLATDCPNMLEGPNAISFIDCTGVSSSGLAFEVDKTRFLEQLKNTYFVPTEEQPIFMRLAQLIYIAPSTVASATAYYYKAVTDLSGDSATTEIPTEFEGFIIKKVSLDIDEILGKMQDKELAARQLSKEISSAYEKFLGKQSEANRIRTNEKAKLQ